MRTKPSFVYFAAVVTLAVAASAAPYESDSFVPGINEKATGFFHVVQRPDGRWWTIDPLGRGMVILGVDHVKYSGHWSYRTKRSVYQDVNKKKFPDRRDWEADTVKRLKEWGFNALGAGCDRSLEHQGLIHTRFLSMGVSLCYTKDETLWIAPYENRPGSFPNVFDPRFEEFCDRSARKHCAQNKDDPWLLGYFIDNELDWGAGGEPGTGIFNAVMKKPDTHSAKIALKDFLKKRGVDGEPSEAVKIDFLRLAADRYFACASAAIRRYDPNHMVLGARFAGIRGAHDVVLEAAGRYCDLVTFNTYPWADLDRNEMFLSRLAGSPRMTDVFAERYAIARRPILITEWSFPALDSGLPCTSGAGQRFRTQKERTAATELFAKTMLASPYLLGYDYFMWVDEPVEGISDAFPEDSNYGLVNLHGEPYRELTEMFAALHRDAGRWRSSPVPEVRVAPPPICPTAREFAARLPRPSAPGGVTFERDGAMYRISTRGGLGLAGRIGKGPVFEVSLNGHDIGTYNTMVNFKDGKMFWKNIANVVDVSFAEENGWGILNVIGEYREADKRHGFSLSQKIAVHPDVPGFVADLTKVVNIGSEPLDVGSLLLRMYAPYANERDVKPSVRNLWKGLPSDAWLRKSDGFWWGGMTKSPVCSQFRFVYNKSAGSQHPDAVFKMQCDAPQGSPAGLWRIAPGAEYDPKGTVWALCIGGSGGLDGWKRQVMAVEVLVK